MKYILLFCVMFTVVAATPVSAQTTGFTYQGSLTNGGVAANGSYDFEFVLFDAAGNQVGTTITVNNVTVANGIFSTRLDFGSQFPGASRFLEIHVRQTGSGTFNVLSPRQSIDSSPYSVKSLTADSSTTAASATNATNFSGNLAGDVSGTQNATVVTAVGGQTAGNISNAVQSINTATANDTASTVIKRDASGNFAAAIITGNLSGNASTATNATQLGGVAANQFVVTGDPRLTDSRAPTAGSSSYVQNTASLQSNTNFNISGNGTAAGTLSALNVSATNYNLNGLAIITHPNVNLFIGLNAGKNTTASPGDNTFVGDSAGTANTTGSSGTFIGLRAGQSNMSGSLNSFFGINAGANNQVGEGNTLVGAFSGLTVTGSENTAIGFQAAVSSGLNNATAIGANAQVTQSNSLVLGSINGQNGAVADTDVAIGTMAPTARLTVVSNTVSSGDNTAVFMAPNIGPNKSHINFGTTGDWFIRSAKDGGTIIIQDSPGNVGIGTGSPDQKLTVNGNASKSVGGTTWAVFSDERLKNVHGNFTRGLSTLMQLQPIRYQYKADNALGLRADSESVGFSAQQVQRVLPEAVSTSTSGYLQLNSDPILWTMLNAIKEEQTEIEAKQKEIDKQNAINKKDEAEIEALKALVCRSHRTAAVCRSKA